MAHPRPVVSVHAIEAPPAPKEGEKKEKVVVPAATHKIPDVFHAPIRPDLVNAIHSAVAKNRRQPYAVNPDAGMQHSAESWGTGRAVARIPRVSGGGTHRAGQAAFGNMCRKGRMCCPTVTWRIWHQKVNLTEKRHAVASAIAASGVPAFVMGRGHLIDAVPEIPLVVANEIEGVKKTSKAIEILEKVGALADVEKARDSKALRSGIGKLRNRRHTMRRGPLVVYNKDDGIVQAFRNLPGVDLCQVDRLSILHLAPGGHIGRFVIWTQSAFARLDSIFGTDGKTSASKHGYHLPRPMMTNTDLSRLISADAIQAKIRPVHRYKSTLRNVGNPLNIHGLMKKLNPYVDARKAQFAAEEANNKKRKSAPNVKKAAKKARKTAVTPFEKLLFEL